MQAMHLASIVASWLLVAMPAIETEGIGTDSPRRLWGVGRSRGLWVAVQDLVGHHLQELLGTRNESRGEERR